MRNLDKKATGLHPVHLLLLLIPICIFLLMSKILYMFFAKPPTNLSKITPEQFPMFEAGARIYLLAIAFLFVVVCLGCSVKVIYELKIWHTLKNQLLLGGGIFVLVVVAGTSFLLALSGDRPSNMDMIGEEWFRKALAAPGVNNWGYQQFDLLLDIVSVATVFSVPLLIVGGIACLDESDVVSRQENWKFQTKRFQTNLFMSAGVLVVGVLLFKSWTHYPIVLLHAPEDEIVKLAFEEIANSLTVYTGLTYSLLLAGYALPIAFLLSK